MFGKKGTGKGQFDAPSSVACDSAGNVYVAVEKTVISKLSVLKGSCLGGVASSSDLVVLTHCVSQ